MLILRTTDRVPCKIGKLTIWIAPLSHGEKTHLYRKARMVKGVVEVDKGKLLFETLELSVKKVDGFEGHELSDGTKAKLKWDHGKLTHESLELLIMVMGQAPASYLSSNIIADTITPDITGFEIDFKKIKDTSKKK